MRISRLSKSGRSVGPSVVVVRDVGMLVRDTNISRIEYEGAIGFPVRNWGEKRYGSEVGIEIFR